MTDVTALASKISAARGVAPAPTAQPAASAPEAAPAKPVQQKPAHTRQSAVKAQADQERRPKPKPEAAQAEGNEAPEISGESDGDTGGDDAPLERPKFWSESKGETWSKLDREAQKAITEWANERGAFETTKTTELAKERQAVEKAQEQARETWNQRFGQLNALYQEVEKAYFGQQPFDGARILQEEGSEAYLMKKEAWENRQREFASVRGKIAEQMRQAQAEAAQRMDGWKAEQRKALVEKIPEWGDPAKAEAKWKEAASYLKDAGFGDEELSGLIDHRHYLIIEDAMQWRRHKAQLPVTEEKLKAAPKMAAPGTSQRAKGPERKLNETRAEHRRNPSVKTLAGLISAQMRSRG